MVLVVVVVVVVLIQARGCLPRCCLTNMEFVQCTGTTRSGRRCSITSKSVMVDALSGRLVAEPLKRGGSFCIYHTVLFCVRKVKVNDAVIVYLDLETSGLSVISDHIVEIGAVADHGAVFSTVVRPPSMPSGPAVHGISNAELQVAPPFSTAFARLVRFIDCLAEAVVSDDESSSDDASGLPCLKGELPHIVIAAHNGMKFDFAMLASECYRHASSPDALVRWKYVDTLEVAKAARMFDCVKLQCALQSSGCMEKLRAHRALDDAFALKAVVRHMAEAYGVSTLKLLAQFTYDFDVSASAAQLSALL